MIALTNGSGAIQERYAYSAYGEAVFINASGTVLGDSAKDNQYTYTGREWDEELSLYHYRARFYHSKAGQFFSRDPIGYLADVNAQRFVVGGPLKYNDPMGLEDVDISVGFPEDFVTYCSWGWNWCVTDVNFTVDPSNANWAELDKYLSNMAPGDCINNLIFNGHGNSGSAGPFNGTNVTNPNSPEHQILTKLKSKMCKTAQVDLRHCLCAKGPNGKKFLTDLSITIGVPVRGIDDIYAVNPHGNEYEALPNGTITKVCEHGPYKNTWICQWQVGKGKKGLKPNKPKPKPRKCQKEKTDVNKPTIPHPFK